MRAFHGPDATDASAFEALAEITDPSERIGGRNRSDTWLHLAARRRGGPVVALAASKAKRINARSGTDGGTALIDALSFGNAAAAQALIEAGADLDARDACGLSILHAATFSADEECLRIALAARPELINSISEADEEFAIEAEIIKPIPMERGRIVAGDGWNEPYEYENDYADPEYDIPEPGSAERRQLFENEGYTPLLCAILQSDPVAVRLLIDAGCDIFAKTPWGTSAIHEACAYRPHPEIVELLISKGATLSDPDEHGKTPLHHAAANSSAEAAAWLVAHGADPLALDKRGRKPSQCVPNGAAVRDMLASAEEARAIRTEIAQPGLPKSKPAL